MVVGPKSDSLKELKSDPLLIKNPFMMNSKVGEVRFGVGAQKPEKVIQTIVKNEGISLHSEQDPKLNFDIINSKEEQIKEYISTDPLDYEIPPEVLNKNSKVKHTQGLPISFLQIKTEEEGVEWYKQHYPQIPDDLLPVIARYHWGEPMTKKGLKNERKKIIKKAEAKGIQVKKGGFVVKFE
tara:strand:- start:4590 stop:5135 length:546 start_codon:yes stop_codon:yes gene_type:complete